MPAVPTYCFICFFFNVLFIFSIRPPQPSLSLAHSHPPTIICMLCSLTFSCMAFMMIWQVHYNAFQSMNYDKPNTVQELNTKRCHCNLPSLPGMEDPGHFLPSVEKHILCHCSVQHRWGEGGFFISYFLSIVDSYVKWIIRYKFTP